MKTRNGFVSNSSSSSFIVKYYDCDHLDVIDKIKTPKSLTKSEIKKLVKFGFVETWNRRPSLIVNSDFMNPKSEFRQFAKDFGDKNGKPYAIFYGYTVSCNQCEPLRFLVKNKISFVASIHYGHETYMYRKGDPYVMVFTNYGLQVETYLRGESWKQITSKNDYANIGNQKPYYKITVKDILADKI